MADNHEIKIGAKIEADSSSLDQLFKKVDDFKRKIEEISIPSSLVKAREQVSSAFTRSGITGTGSVSPPTEEAMRDATQQKMRGYSNLMKEQGNLFSEQENKLKKLSGDIGKLQEEMKKYKDENKEVVDLQEQLNRKKQDFVKFSEKHLELAKNIVKTEKEMTETGPKTPSPLIGAKGWAEMGMVPPPKPPSDELKMPPGFDASKLPAAMSALGGIMYFASELTKQIGQSPLRTEVAAGAAAQGTYGRELGGVYGGRSVYEAAMLPEKTRATETAKASTETTRTFERLKLIAGTAVLGAAGLAAASGVGLPLAGVAAAGGSYLLGGSQASRSMTTGMAAGVAGDVSQSITGGRPNAVSNFFRGVEGGQTKEFNALMAQDFAENFTKALAAEQQMNPLKKAASEEYDKNLMKYLHIQRTLGLDYSTFHGQGGYKDIVAGAGFTPDSGYGASQGILAAGGTTRAAGAMGATTALQAERGFNLTNAPQALGTLARNIGGAAESKQAFISILAEGMKLGLDKSEFAEENRKFVQTTAEIVQRSGATTPEGARQRMEEFTKFVSEPTSTAGIEAAKTAYKIVNDAMSEMSGQRGAMRAAALHREPIFNKLGSTGQFAAALLPAEQVGPDHPLVQAIANLTGSTPEEVVKARHRMDTAGLFRLPGTQKAIDRARKAHNQLGPLTPQQENEAKRAESQETIAVAAEFPEALKLPESSKVLPSIIKGLESGKEEDRQKSLSQLQDMEKQASTKLETKETGKKEDTSMQLLAESSKLVTENFQKYSNEIVKGAEVQRAFNLELVNSISSMEKAFRSGTISEKQLQEFYTKVSPGLGLEKPKTQTQSSTPGH